MKIFITGGSGFIGRNLIPFLLNKYPSYTIINLDRQIWNYPHQQYTFVEGDVRKYELVSKSLQENEIEAIINLVEDKSGSTLKQIESNVCGQQVLLESARDMELERFLYLSSDKVYATDDQASLNRAVSEKNIIEAHDLESAHRISAESLALAHYHQYQVPVVILRPADCLGPWLNPNRLSYLLITSALHNNPLPLYNEGKKIQEWMHINDLCRAVDKILHLKTVKGETFNLGWGGQHSLLDLSKLILTHLGKPESLLRFMEEKRIIFSKPPLDSSKAKSILGWEPKIPFTDSLQRTVKWFKANSDWWEES